MSTDLKVKNQGKIPLTKDISVNDGSHILYFYKSKETYIQNAVSFILNAYELGQKVVFIDTFGHLNSVLAELDHYLEKDEVNSLIEYINNYEFYEMYQDFHFERVLDNFNNAIKYYVENDISIRVWGHVDWRKQEHIDEKVSAYESEADLSVNEIGYITVCTYNAVEVPAYIQTELLKSHEYLMTDDQLVRSSLYKKTEDVVFPTLSSENEIQTELDFYKRKLDFIHVVSHEVRNPLTVIKSFSTLLKERLQDDVSKQYLQLISDYSDAIDHEINHIIQTEQMLTTDALWKIKLVKISPILSDVINIMDIKARTQNIKLECDLNFDENLIIKGNSMGMRLIFSNIISNAIKYSDEGTDIHIQAYIQEGSFIFEVEDHGVGMSDEQLGKLFRKYEKINENKSGQGIGLFMVNHLTEYFKGNISVESELGVGSKFVIKFPV